MISKPVVIYYKRRVRSIFLVAVGLVSALALAQPPTPPAKPKPLAECAGGRLERDGVLHLLDEVGGELGTVQLDAPHGEPAAATVTPVEAEGHRLVWARARLGRDFSVDCIPYFDCVLFALVGGKPGPHQRDAVIGLIVTHQVADAQNYVQAANGMA